MRFTQMSTASREVKVRPSFTCSWRFFCVKNVALTSLQTECVLEVIRPYRYSSKLVVGTTSSVKARGSVVSNRIGMKIGRNVHLVNTHGLTRVRFPFDVIISKRRSWRHFTSESATTWWVKMKRLLRDIAALHVSSWSIVHWYPLMTCVLRLRHMCAFCSLRSYDLTTLYKSILIIIIIIIISISCW